MSSDSALAFYQRNADRWLQDRRRETHRYEQGWLERFAAMLPASAVVLDLGCGEGTPLAVWFIAKGHRVVGVDSAPRMIAHAQAQFPQQQWIVGDMRALALGRKFDGILAWDSFFHLSRDDQRAIFPIFRQHTKPGAPLMFTAGPKNCEAIGTLFGEELFHASLGPSEYRAALAEHGFDEVCHIMQDPDCSGRTVWLARFRL